MRVEYSHHLVGLVARAHLAAARLAAQDPDRRAALSSDARRRSAALSARLDGSPLADETAARVDSGDNPVLDEVPEATTAALGWAQALSSRALNIDDADTQALAAVEYANLRRLAPIEADLAGAVMAHPRDTLARIQGVVCAGLVAPDVIGRLRVTEQAVHDGAQGMVIYNAMAPARIPEAMAELEEWVTRRSLTVDPFVTAGVVHGRLLEIQPFEAGNGRVARAVTRVILAAHGIDAVGAAVLEAPLWASRGGYYAEIAATIRRKGDLRPWLERHTAAVAAALEAATDAMAPALSPAVPERGREVVRRVRPGTTISLRDYAQDVGVDLRTAHADLTTFVRARVLVDVPGAAGLRFAPAATPDQPTPQP